MARPAFAAGSAPADGTAIGPESRPTSNELFGEPGLACRWAMLGISRIVAGTILPGTPQFAAVGGNGPTPARKAGAAEDIDHGWPACTPTGVEPRATPGPAETKVEPWAGPGAEAGCAAGPATAAAGVEPATL